ncbi:N-acetylglucosamine-6-phosphate deacetylase [Modestobacter sp. Leaf380]|nr:N-acetylglucosamine-6-phosphate deacetylase [Modestobacter sp. Leaf380]
MRGRLVSGGSVVDDAVVVLDGDRVTHVGPAAEHPDPPPATDLLLLPGLVDVHCHGGAGGSFPDSDQAGVRRAARHHRAAGTTTLLASLVSAAPEVLRERLAVLAPLVGDLVAGVHLEGPYLSPARCGAQDPAALRPGDPAELDALLATGLVRSVTVAPETAHAAELLAVCRMHGVLPSLGHTDADAATTTGWVRRAGPRASATHLFNGMPPLLSRAPGPVAACLAAAARGDLVVELVADGVHLAPETVATVFELVGPDHVALVSDAMAAAGQPDGAYRLGALDVTVRDGVARLTADPGAIAGGTATLADVLRRTVRDAGVDLAAAVTAATRTPARLLGLDAEVGELTPGRRADVLVTTPDLVPAAVYAAGVRVHREEN